MAISYTGRLSGVLRAVAPRVRFVLDAPRILVLSMLTIMGGVFILASCYLSRTIDQATADDVNNRSFTFTSGAVFNSALANVSTALAFSNNAQSFTLCSGSQTASGTNKFGSCTLTVTNSNYTASAGPQINDVITLDPCDFDSDANTLTVSKGNVTATSAAATTATGTGCSTGTSATADNVNGQSFTFTNGGVFSSALQNVQTALAFSNQAQNFTLRSVGTVSETATGTSIVSGGSCSLTVTTSSYSAGPQKGTTITLTPCTYNSTNNTLTVTNLGLTVTSATGIITQ
jgi:hypothetical protein